MWLYFWSRLLSTFMYIAIMLCERSLSVCVIKLQDPFSLVPMTHLLKRILRINPTYARKESSKMYSQRGLLLTCHSCLILSCFLFFPAPHFRLQIFYYVFLLSPVLWKIVKCQSYHIDQNTLQDVVKELPNINCTLMNIYLNTGRLTNMKVRAS